ncbi:MAG: hypothetical protein KKA56_00665 [Gammaproteobacteria bacterium]|nr:hypothetical protein [Gammaproteobacteria bacterium]
MSSTLFQPPQLALLQNEWRFYRVQPLCWLALILALAFALLTTVGSDVQTAQPYKELLFSHTKLLMILQPLLIGALAPLAFLRDQQHGMTELTGVTPISSRQWCISRAGALLAIVIGVQMLLLLLAGIAVELAIDRQLTTDSNLWLFSITLFFVQQLPALLLLVALQLWCSRKTHNTSLLYLLTAVCFLGYLLLAAASGSPVMANPQQLSPVLPQLMLYLDPYALTPWLAQLERDASIYPDGTVLLNRLLMLLLSAGLFWRAIQAEPKQSTLRKTSRFAFFTPGSRAASLQIASLPATSMQALPSITSSKPNLYRAITPAVAFGGQSLISLLHLQWQQLIRQRSTVLALLLLTGLVFSEALNGVDYAEPLSQLLPTSRDALNRVNWDVLPRFGLLLVALWASQLSGLNRQRRCDSLVAVTPVSSAVLLSSQLLVLWLLTLLFVGLCLSAVALAQLLLNVPLQPAEYLQQGLFVLQPLLMWGMLLLACHAILKTPLRANLLVAGLFMFALTPLPDLLQLHHPLWRVGQTQLQMPDALWGYQGSAGGISGSGSFSHGGFWPFALFWALLALTLWLLALQRYHRGTGYSTPKRWLTKLTMTPIAIVTALLALLWLTQGLHIHQQLQQAGVLQTASQQQALRAAYEQQYQQWQQQPQPVVSKVKLQVDLFPAEQSAVINAQLTLTNPHPTAIRQLLIGFPTSRTGQQLQTPDDIRVDGARLQTFDQQLAQRIYQLDQPLAPGATTTLHLTRHLKQHAIAQAPQHQVLRSEFSYLRMLQLLPQPGFLPELRLRDSQLRAEHGLTPLSAAEIQPSVLAATATPATARYDWAQLETVVSVPQGYQGIAAGKLLRQWQQQQRQYFHYQTSNAVRNLPAVVAVPWQPKRVLQNGLPLEIYSPEYNAATDLTQQAMQHTIEWFNQHIGAYPGDALRLVMVPDLGPTGYALPQLILINHRVGVRAFPVSSAGFSQVYRRTVHEVAHQWFGHGIGNGVTGDSAFLVESLAKYAELVIIEQHFGVDAMQALVEFERERYSRAHAGSRSEQKNLIDADESYDQYSRATLVFAKLRQEVGDTVLVATLHQLWQQHRYPAKPASAMDFVRALQANSPPSAHPLIHTLLLELDTSLLSE